MNEHDALLRTIRDSPQDNTARLVFADWLQENGEGEYAEFIRVQIELARLGPTPRRLFASRIDPTPAGGGELLVTCDVRWTEGLPVVGDVVDIIPRRSVDNPSALLGLLVDEVHEYPPKQLGYPAMFGVVVWPGAQDLFPNRARYNALSQRQNELLARNERDGWSWFGLPRPWATTVAVAPFLVPPAGPYAVAERGFLDLIIAPTTETWLQYGDEICAAHPVTNVRQPPGMQLVYCGDGVRFGLTGDPTARTFTQTEIHEAAKSRPELLGLSELDLVRRLRWPRVTFESEPFPCR